MVLFFFLDPLISPSPFRVKVKVRKALVNATSKEPTLCAEDVAKFPSINKNTNVLHAVSLQPKLENVKIF